VILDRIGFPPYFSLGKTHYNTAADSTDTSHMVLPVTVAGLFPVTAVAFADFVDAASAFMVPS
jgi:hypothetical protein